MQTNYSTKQVRKGTLLLTSVLTPLSIVLIYIVATHWSPHPNRGDKVLLGFCSAGMVMLLLIWGKVWWARGFLFNLSISNAFGAGLNVIGQALKALSGLLHTQEAFLNNLVPTISAMDTILLMLAVPACVYICRVLTSEDVDAYFGKPYDPNG